MRKLLVIEVRKMNIVLAPGYMLDANLWADLIPRLGDTLVPFYADLTKDASIDGMAQRLLNDAPEQFVLVGFSLGGYVAREAARRAPDRVRGLILIATSSRGDSAVQRQRKLARTSASFGGLSRSAIRGSLAPGNASQDLISRIQRMGEALGGEVFERQSALVRLGDTERLAEIKCPTLVVAGSEDALRSLSESEELHVGISQSTLSVIAGSGHMIPMEAPGSLAREIIPWLQELAD